MLRLDTHAVLESVSEPLLVKVVSLDEFARRGWDPRQSAPLLSAATPGDERRDILRLPWAACLSRERRCRPQGWAGPWVHSLRDPEVVAVGDVIAIAPGSRMIKVMYRRGSNSNTLFLTDRCNSRCLMCSQPPSEQDDSWRLEENLRLLRLVDPEEPCLGITGGEPTLLGPGLMEIIQTSRNTLPSTDLHLLSNGRLLGSTDLVDRIAAIAHTGLIWAIPLYADTAARHDRIVQAQGAFEETLAGLYRLASYRQPVEVRVVLQRLTLDRLEQLAYFIFRNLAFARHVAFMGLEPMGFARSNYAILWEDPVDFGGKLEGAVHFLANRGMQVSIYNLPLCTLPRSVWPFARQSISDWKNRYVEICSGCAARCLCSGFFSSSAAKWEGRGIRPLSDDEVYFDVAAS